jgi:hypothetical protein
MLSKAVPGSPAYMPYYRVGRVCSWDIGALALIVWGTFWIFRRQRRSRVAAQHQVS